MSEQDKFFSPQHVDESLEQLISPERSGNVFPRLGRLNPNERLVQDLQDTYGLERRSYQQALQRVEDRLVERHSTSSKRDLKRSPAQNLRPLQTSEITRRRLKNMEHRESRHIPSRQRINLLVASLVMIVLVGSLIVVLNLTNGKSQLGSGSSPTLQTTLGQTVYTTPSGMGDFNSLAFSPDSQRIVAARTNGAVQIWDATTGKHLVNVNVHAEGFFVTWSPNGQLVAIGTISELVIANSRTGVVVHASSLPVLGMSTSGGGTGLASRMQNSGGSGVSGVTWSPDGRYIAASVHLGSSDYVQVMDAQTYASLYQLQSDTNFAVSTLAWSVDGQYLAATSSNPGTSTKKIEAWKIATRQMVFDKSAGAGQVGFQSGNNGTSNPLAFRSGLPTGYGASLAFQPHTDNITFALLGSASIETWNVATGKLVKSYPVQVAVSGLLVWSPGGQEIAYADGSVTGQVDIINAQTGQNVYSYSGDAGQTLAALAWSPDGKYIASGEAKGVARVWVAE